MTSYAAAGPRKGRGSVPSDDRSLFAHRLLLTLCPQATEFCADSGTAIVHEGDSASFFLLVLDGWIGLSKALHDGQTQFVDLLLPGDYALVATGKTAKVPYSAEALGALRYIAFTMDVINGPETEAAALRRYIASTIAARQARMAESLLRMGQGSAGMRIAYALLELFVRLEAVGKTEGQRFHVPMNQRQLGQFTGLTNVHVCRTLRRFSRKGIVTSGSHTDFEIVDIDQLCGLADIDLDGLRAEIVVELPA